jgi:predicted CXXCH cytochrome family protein
MKTLIRTAALIALAAGPAFSAKDSCFDCHSVMEGMSIPFKNDIHYKNGISCADCHGGDPNSDDQNISMSAQRGFKVRVTRQAVSEYCARCHSDAAFMQKHNPKQRVDQSALYGTSVHAGKPAGSDSMAANCIDCHGIHNIRAVSDPQSAVAPGRLAGMCGKCHADSAAMFRKSAHAAVFVTSEMASCAICHSSHSTQRVSGEMLAGGRAVCARCHEPESKGGKTAASLGRAFENGMRAAFEAAGSRGDAGRGAGAPPGGRGGAGRGAFNQRLRKALSTVHSLDVAAVKAAIEAGAKKP